MFRAGRRQVCAITETQIKTVVKSVGRPGQGAVKGHTWGAVELGRMEQVETAS